MLVVMVYWHGEGTYLGLLCIVHMCVPLCTLALAHIRQVTLLVAFSGALTSGRVVSGNGRADMLDLAGFVT